MNQRTARIRFGLRLATLAAAAIMLGGCSTYYQSYYPDSGVYYGDSGVYGHSPGYSRVGYGPVNPAAYPYWSIDYFYFSQYYHPYSVFVGYNEPLYYPYPGWAFGHYRPARWHGSLAFGFGYPWYGHGYRYPAYTFGFFSGYDPYYYRRRDPYDRYGHHRIRRIDQRLQALQYDDSYASRRALLGRDRVAGSVGGGQDYSRDRAGNITARSQSRNDMLRQRGSDGSRALQRRDAAPDRSVQRRAPDVRSDRRTLDRNRIRRDGGGTAAEGHRGIPMERLRGRVIVNSGSRSGGYSGSSDARDRDAARRDRAAAQRDIRRAPALDWNSSERRSRQQSPDRASRSAESASRGSVPNRSTRNVVAPAKRPERRAAPPPRRARDARSISRPEPASRASSPSRRSIMRQRSAGDGAGRDRRDRRR